MQKQFIALAIAIFAIGITTIYLLSKNRSEDSEITECVFLKASDTISVKPEQMICISIEYSVGTNYHDYTVEFDISKIEFVTSEKIYMRTDCDGCPLEEIFSLKAKSSGIHEIKLVNVSNGALEMLKSDTTGEYSNIERYYIECKK